MDYKRYAFDFGLYIGLYYFLDYLNEPTNFYQSLAICLVALFISGSLTNTVFGPKERK